MNKTNTLHWYDVKYVNGTISYEVKNKYGCVKSHTMCASELGFISYMFRSDSKKQELLFKLAHELADKDVRQFTKYLC